MIIDKSTCLIDIVKVSLSIIQYNLVSFINYLQAFTWVYNYVRFIYAQQAVSLRPSP